MESEIKYPFDDSMLNHLEEIFPNFKIEEKNKETICIYTSDGNNPIYQLTHRSGGLYADIVIEDAYRYSTLAKSLCDNLNQRIYATFTVDVYQYIQTRNPIQTVDDLKNDFSELKKFFETYAPNNVGTNEA